jgi:large subunit ribosomal protein L9
MEFCMKVILRESYETLGAVGDVVEVKDGYARNYLIPRKIAYPATKGNIRALDEEKKQRVMREQKDLRQAQKLAEEVEKISITIPMQVGEDDKLFGAVTSQMVADALKEKGYEVDRRKIELDEPIKALGIYTVNVKLHQNVTGKVKVWVIRQ